MEKDKIELYEQLKATLNLYDIKIVEEINESEPSDDGELRTFLCKKDGEETSILADLYDDESVDIYYKNSEDSIFQGKLRNIQKESPLNKIVEQYENSLEKNTLSENSKNAYSSYLKDDIYPLITLTLDSQKRAMKELLTEGKLITDEYFKNPFERYFKYVRNEIPIKEEGITTGVFGVYENDIFIRQMNEFDFQIKQPIVFEKIIEEHEKNKEVESLKPKLHKQR